VLALHALTSSYLGKSGRSTPSTILGRTSGKWPGGPDVGPETWAGVNWDGARVNCHLCCHRDRGEKVSQKVIDSMEVALRGLDVSAGTLTPEVRGALDREGFAVFSSLLDDRRIEALKQRIEELERSEDAWGAGTNPDDPGAIRVENLNHKGPMFDDLWLHPVLLAVLEYLLVDFRLGSMTSRSPRPQSGHQRLHRDGPRVFADSPTSCQTAWMLDDFNVVRGTTRLVPGSHRFPSRPEDTMDDPELAHPDQVLVEAPRGSLMVFNGYLWHGGTENTTDLLRHAVFSFYVRRDQARKYDQGALLDELTQSRLSPEARYVLDV
jgi:ectoine hydroxylase-related dioxygenase (phytanoyl-CoA dioxygenase family)